MKAILFNRPWRSYEHASSGRWASGAALAAALLLLATANLRAGAPNGVVVGSVCGGGTSPFYGYVEGNPADSTIAKFHTPIGLALDSTGELLYVADQANNAIRVVDLLSSSTHFNLTYTFAPIPGYTSGTITSPVGVALDADDNVYVLNRGNGKNGRVVVFDSYYYYPLATNTLALTNANALTLDNAGNVYVTASNNLFRITFPSGVTTRITNVTSAGANLQGLVVMDNGMIAVCDSGRHGIYLINPTNRAISTLTGFNGKGDNTNIWNNTPNFPVAKTNAMFNQPMGLAKAGGGMLIVADYGNHRVKVVNSVGTVTNLYGVSSNLWWNMRPWPGWSDGNVTVPDAVGDVEARLPNGVLLAPGGTVYVTEDYYHLIRMVTGAHFPPPAPHAPASLTALASCGQVSLTWSASLGATNYNVRRSTSSGGPYTNNTIASTSSTGYTDTNVLSGTTYYYVVSAAGAGGEGSNSGEVNATPPLPPAPTIFTVITNYSQIALTWSTVPCPSATYNVKRSTFSGGPYSTLTNTSSTAYTDTSVLVGTTYYYVVSALSDGGEGPNSAEVSARLALPPASLFNGPKGLALNSVGSLLYIADQTNNAIQALNLANNLTTTFLNATDGISRPVDVAVDSGDNLYVLNQSTPGNGFILKFDRFGNLLATVATNLALPTALKLDGYGSLFVTEQGGAVQQFSGGTSNTLATITTAGVKLQGIALFDDGTIAVSDAGNHVIWQVHPVTKAVSLLTGSIGVPGTTLGAASFAKLNQPQQLARAAGNLLVAADYGNNRLVVVDRSGSITNILNSTNALVWYGRTGDPHGSSDSQFVAMVTPVGVTLSSAGQVFTSEVLYNDIRKLLNTGLASTPVPDFPSPLLNGPRGLALNSSGSLLYIADQTNNAIQALNLANNLTTTFLNATDGISQPVDVAVDSGDNLYVLNQSTPGNGFILKFDRFGNLLATVATNLALPTALKLDGYGSLFVTEQGGAVQQFSGGTSNTLATITTAGVQLQGLALFDDGTIAVSDAGKHVIWQISPITKAVTLLTGIIGSPGATLGAVGYARLNQPHKLARAAGNLLVAADYGNNRLVVVDRSGSITNILNSTNALVWYGQSGDPHGSSDALFAPMVAPVGVLLGSDGGVYASEVVYDDIRKILGTGLLAPPPLRLPTPVISPNSGYYPMGQTITVSSLNPSVYYTADGSEPTTNSKPVTMSGTVGFINWFNSTNDLRNLRVKALTTDAVSDTVAGQPATINTIGVPPDADPAIYAGIGSQVVVPVVVNLQSNGVVQSCQFRVELSPIGSALPISSGFDVLSLSASPSDFVPLAWPVLSGLPGSITVQHYSIGSTAGLQIAALGPNAMSFQNFTVVALLRIAIPAGASEGDSYALAVSYPSATSDGGHASVPLTAMDPATILVTNLTYKVGDSASVSGGWYNAGEFGNGDLDNSDANLAFYASLGMRIPYAFSDVFNAMDAYPVDEAGFVGGDGLIRYLDWNVILQRSLRRDTNNWARAWSTGGNLVEVSTTLAAFKAVAQLAQAKAPPAWPWYRQALVGAVSTGNAIPGRTVSVPVYVKLSDGAALSGIQFRAIVTPQGGAPSLAQAPQLSLTSGVPGPTLQQSFGATDAGFGWVLGSFNYLSRSSNFLGWVTFTIPATAQSGQTYSVSFANADGAPNLNAQYDFETRSACVAVGGSAPPASICSDDWKIHFFGSLTNPNAADLADADGDGIPNWREYSAGTDPADPNSRLQLSGPTTQAGKALSQQTIQWLTAPGKAYEVQWSPNLSGGSWTTLAIVSGNGTVASYSDTNITAAVRYYRLHVLP